MVKRLENLDFIINHLMADNHVSYQIPSLIKEKQRMMRALMNVREPRPIAEFFLNMQNAELRTQAVEKGIVDIKQDGLQMWQGDITRLRVDAIVNAANAQALGCWTPLHNCIDNCIHSAAGIQLRQECSDIMQGGLLATGDAFITQGYNLPAKHVIHTVGPIIDEDWPTKEQEKQLAQCYRSCLDIAERHLLQSIAFCCISTGVFHFPNEQAAEIAIETVKDYPRNSVKTIIFNVFLDKDHDIYKRLLTED